MGSARTRSGFTLIELMVAMMLMTMVTATCIWVFRKSLDIYQTATGNAEVNQSLRVAFEKINQDLSACLPLSSGEQRFLMIGRFGEDEEWGKSFPRDYLSFATTTRVKGDTTTALVSYDITETISGLPILWRYSQKTSDLPLAHPVNGSEVSTVREVLCEYCTEFRLEYLWYDPRPKGAAIHSGVAFEKQAEDPGLFLGLWPFLNEAGGAGNLAAKDAWNPADNNGYLTGGLNGTSVLQHPPAGAHAGAATHVQDEFYKSYLFPHVAAITPTNHGIVIPFRDFGSNPANYEMAEAAPGWLRKRGSSVGYVSPAGMPNTTEYNRIILIRSSALVNDHLAGGTTAFASTDPPLDITANYASPAVIGANIPAGFNPPGTSLFATANPTLWPTYVPQQIRVTMKAHNKSRSVLLTRTKTFWIPSSGS